MSLDSLSRYDDAEDEIKDEDHNLLITKDVETVPQQPSEQSSPRPPSDLGSKPTKSLVSYNDEYTDDEESDNDSEENDDTLQSKTSVVNLRLYDGSAVLSSAGSTSPSSVDNTVESTKEVNDGVKLPPEPEGRCSKSLQEKIARMMDKKNSGMNVNDYVQRKKEFRNPSIYEKLVNFIGIDEHGTNFPKHLFDPSIWGPESFYEALAKTQKEHHDKKEKEKLKRTHVEFITGTKKTVTTQTTTATTTATAEKKSKWDQRK